ncbi:MAG: heparinase II/III domain-containing protein [Kiritimatiellia bacterium]
MARIAATVCPALSVSAMTTVPPYGMCIHRMHFPGDRAAAFPVLSESGVRYIRCDIDWRWLEPEKGVFDFAPWDALFADAERSGLKILPILHRGAKWTEPLMEHLDDWANYVRVFTERYGRHVDAIEIWNEANLGHCFPGAPGDYAEVLRIAYTTIKEIDPRIRVTTSGFAGAAVPYLEAIYRSGGRDTFDVVNFHFYAFPHDFEDRFEEEFTKLRRTMKTFGDGEKPVWLTETGYPTQHPSLSAHGLLKNQLPEFNASRKSWRADLVTLGDETDDQLAGCRRLFASELPEGSSLRFVGAGALAETLASDPPDLLVYPFHEKFPADSVEHVLAFIRQGGVLAQFGEAPMTYLAKADADGVYVASKRPDGASARRRFGFDVTVAYSDRRAPVNANVTAVPACSNTLIRARCSRWIHSVPSTDLPGLSLTPLLTTKAEDGTEWIAAARLKMPGEEAGGVLVSCLDEKDENLFPSDEARQAKMVPRTFLAAEHVGVEQVFWYVYKTWEGKTPERMFDREKFFGVVHPAQDAKKPAMVAMTAFAQARPPGSLRHEGLWKDDLDGLFHPQWTTPEGVASGALWLRSRRLADPPRTAMTLSFDSDKMTFRDCMGRPLANVVELGGGRYRLPIGDAPVFFHGGRLVTTIGAALATARADHPRLCVKGASDFARLRSRIDSQPEGLVARISRMALLEADALLDAPLVERKLEGRRLLAAAGKVRDRVETLAGAFQLTGDSRYSTRAKRELLAAAAWEDWNPSHWLDPAVLLSAVGIGYDWLFDEWTDEERRLLRESCATKAFDTIHGMGRANDFWRNGDSNWTTTCWAGVLKAVLAFHEDMPERAEPLMSEAVRRLPWPMQMLDPRGCYPEGPSYWGSIINHAVAVDCLESALGTSFGLADFPGLKATADYMEWMSGTSGFLYNYSDSGTTPYFERTFRPLQIWFARRFGQRDMAEWDLTALEQLLTDWNPGAPLPELGMNKILLALWCLDVPMEKSSAAPSRPLDWHSGGSVPVVVMRGGRGKDAAYLGCKGGKGAVSHGHDDSGSFVFDHKGVRWALDLGANPYFAIEKTGINLWDNWAREPERWKVFRLSNRGHNVVAIDDRPFDNFGFADFTKTDFSEAIASAALNLDETYSRQATSARRTFALERETGALTITDEFTGLPPKAQAVWRLFTGVADAHRCADGVELAEGGHRKRLSMKATADGDWAVRPANELLNAWDAPLDGITVIEFKVSVPDDGALKLVARLDDVLSHASR